MAEYSEELTKYIGETELKAQQAGIDRGPFARYTAFRDALSSLEASGLSTTDMRTARGILEIRAEQTKPKNIGCASGGDGEAD